MRYLQTVTSTDLGQPEMRRPAAAAVPAGLLDSPRETMAAAVVVIKRRHFLKNNSSATLELVAFPANFQTLQRCFYGLLRPCYIV